MSETDSFIEEVTEEVRRDKLFALMRKYGWVAILVIVLLVGGAAFNEWRKAQARAQAQARGDAIVAALNLADAAERAAALARLSGEGDVGAVVGLLAASEFVAAGDLSSAADRLRAIAGDAENSAVYRQLAELKLAILEADNLTPDELLARLEPLAVPGAPFRLLAEEQMAVADIAAGRTDQAIARLQAILSDTEVTSGLRRRASQLIVALGGEIEPS